MLKGLHWGRCDRFPCSNCALELLDENAFYSGANSKIFLCMREMFEKSIPIDIVTLADTWRKKGWLSAVGEETYLVT